MSPISVLIIDDEPSVRKAIVAALTKEEIGASCAAGAAEALALLEKQHFDVILLDIIMPDQDGFSFLKKVRALEIFTPVILLSGRIEDSAQVEGLGLGADDYMTKPFNKTVLVSKIRAISRRANLYAPSAEAIKSSFTIGCFTVHLDSQTVYKGEREISLTSREFALLYLFLENPEHVFAKDEIFSRVWKSPDTDNNTILVYIKRLRNKIEDTPSKPEHILTVRNVGYQFFL